MTSTYANGNAPIITASVEDVNTNTIALTGDRSKLIRYHSDARASMVANAQGGAAIDESLYIIRNGNKTGYGSISTFYSVANDLFSFSAEDDRGNIGKAVIQADMVDYVRLTCNIVSARPDVDGNMTIVCQGNYFNGSFGAKYNSLLVEYVCEGSDGSYKTGYMSVTTGSSSYRATAALTGLKYQSTYTVTITASDRLEDVTIVESGVRSKPIFHWGENDFEFEVPVSFNHYGGIWCNGDLRLKGDGNYGNSLYFGDGDYCCLTEETDDCLTIKANDLNLSVSNVRMNDHPVCGLWNPWLTRVGINSYTTRSGWYQRIGNVVTIGWHVKVDIESGYHDTIIELEGVPYLPEVSAFGGGIAFNVYTGAGFIFEGWNIDTDGIITARVQPCNKDTAGNLQISSGCYYPYNGGVMSLGGTISYIAAD